MTKIEFADGIYVRHIKMNKKEGVQITYKKNTIRNATVNNPKLQEFLMYFVCKKKRISIKTIRQLCSLKEIDWLCYIDCLEYEILKNRSPEDRSEEYLTNFGNDLNTPDESRVLNEELFDDIKYEYSNVKLTYDLYKTLRFYDFWNHHLKQLQFIKDNNNENCSPAKIESAAAPNIG